MPRAITRIYSWNVRIYATWNGLLRSVSSLSVVDEFNKEAPQRIEPGSEVFLEQVSAEICLVTSWGIWVGLQRRWVSSPES